MTVEHLWAAGEDVLVFCPLEVGSRGQPYMGARVIGVSRGISLLPGSTTPCASNCAATAPRRFAEAPWRRFCWPAHLRVHVVNIQPSITGRVRVGRILAGQKSRRSLWWPSYQHPNAAPKYLEQHNGVRPAGSTLGSGNCSQPGPTTQSRELQHLQTSRRMG